MNFKSITSWLAFLGVIGFLPSHANSSGIPFEKSGMIDLDNYQKSSILRRSPKASLALIDSDEGSIKLALSESDSPIYNYFLSLHHSGKTRIRLMSAYDGQPIAYCTIEFIPINSSKAQFNVVEDSTYLGCGIDKDGYIAINFRYT